MEVVHENMLHTNGIDVFECSHENEHGQKSADEEERIDCEHRSEEQLHDQGLMQVVQHVDDIVRDGQLKDVGMSENDPEQGEDANAVEECVLSVVIVRREDAFQRRERRILVKTGNERGRADEYTE